jgi:hypothetical protein
MSKRSGRAIARLQRALADLDVAAIGLAGLTLRA